MAPAAGRRYTGGMRLAIAAALLLAAAAAAEPSSEYRLTPEQYPGQLARLRLAVLYPPPVREVPAPAAGSRLERFVAAVDPILDEMRALDAYLRERLRDPRGVDETRRQWDEAWRRLDADAARLKPLTADAEAQEREAVSGQSRYVPSKEGYRTLEDAPSFPGREGERLHRAAVAAAYAWNLREFLLRKSAEAAHAPARSALERASR